MQSSVAFLFAIVVFDRGFLGSVSAQPTTAPLTQGINSTTEDEIPFLTKKFVPSLFAKTNWFRAYQYCRFHGMHLASIETQEEERQLISELEKSGLNEDDFPIWTSGNNLAYEGDFVWMSSGKAMTYRNWGKDQPSGGSSRNCVALTNRGDRTLQWNSEHCLEKNYRFVCEHYVTNDKCLTSERRII